jgi:glycosyltransferase involved in cell wall biosynthesis
MIMRPTRTTFPPEDRPLDVLLVGINYAPESSGIAPYSAGLAAGLVRRGHRVRVLTTMPHYPEWRIQDAYGGRTRREVIDGVEVTRLRHYVPAKPVGVRRLLSELSFGLRLVLARWRRPGVVLFVSPALFSTAMGIVRARLVARRTPVAVWTQDIYSLGIVETASPGAGGAVERIITAAERFVARSADAAVVIHDRFADTAVRLGADPARTAVIRNWSHLTEAPAQDPAEVRRLLGWRDDEVVALHTGNMGVKQDLGNIVEAARAADAQHARVRFVVMGDGSQRRVLEELAVGVDRIAIVDPLPKAMYLDALRAADVLIVNEAEGLREMAVPSKLTSYFTAGRPVVAATDAASITAAEVRAAAAGVRVEPADPDALLAAVLAVVEDPEEAVAYGESAQAYQRDVLSEDAALDAFEVCLRAVRDAPRPRAAGARRGASSADRGGHDRLARASL